MAVPLGAADGGGRGLRVEFNSAGMDGEGCGYQGEVDDPCWDAGLPVHICLSQDEAECSSHMNHKPDINVLLASQAAEIISIGHICTIGLGLGPMLGAGEPLKVGCDEIVRGGGPSGEQCEGFHWVASRASFDADPVVAVIESETEN